jgi:hypothetical protein
MKKKTILALLTATLIFCGVLTADAKDFDYHKVNKVNGHHLHIYGHIDYGTFSGDLTHADFWIDDAEDGTHIHYQWEAYNPHNSSNQNNNPFNDPNYNDLGSYQPNWNPLNLNNNGTVLANNTCGLETDGNGSVLPFNEVDFYNAVQLISETP